MIILTHIHIQIGGHYGIQHNDNRRNDTQHKGLIYDTWPK
jgi:hypothetical protein